MKIPRFYSLKAIIITLMAILSVLFYFLSPLYIGILVIVFVLSLFFVKPIFTISLFLVIRAFIEYFGYAKIGIFTPAAFLGMFFIVGVILVIIIKKESALFRVPMITSFAFFLGFSLLTVFQSPFVVPSLTEWSRFFSIFLMYVFTYFSIKSRKDAKILLSALAVASLIPALEGFHQFIVKPSYLRMSPYVWGYSRSFLRIVGTFNGPIPFGDFLGILIVFFTVYIFIQRTKYTKFLIIPIGVWVFLLLNTYSRASWISVFVALLFATIFAKKLKYAFVVLIISAIIVSFNSSIVLRFRDLFVATAGAENTLLGRFELWRKTFYVLSKNSPIFWILGSGIGTYVKLVYLACGEYLMAHNVFVTVLFELGIVGFSLYVWVKIAILVYSFRAYKNSKGAFDKAVTLGTLCAFIGFGILTPLTENRFSSPGINWFLFVLLGIALKLKSLDKEEKR